MPAARDQLTKMVILLSLFIQLLIAHSWGAEECSRVAVVNYQEVLVDASSSSRGEGLRYYLQKDPAAKRLLDQYQENNRPRWQGAALSTAGSAMILAGLLRAGGSDDNNFTNRNNLIIGGAAFVALSYLISRTNQYNNEHLLQRSVEEYNKRNSPRIYFSADPSTGNRQGFGLGLQQEF